MEHESHQERDLVITGARVYTADRARPWAEAVVARGGTIVFVGAEDEALRRCAARTERIHLPGGLVVPGLNDSHMHMMWGAANAGLLDLQAAETLPAVQEGLRAYAAAHPEHEWIVAYGLPYEWLRDLHGPEREALDEVVAGRPVFISAMDTHSAWANTAALRRAGLERGRVLPPPHEVVVDPASGLATGMLKERLATDLVKDLLDQPGEEESDALLAEAARSLNSLGITSVQNMNGTPEDLARYRRLEEHGLLSVRAAHYLNVREDTPLDRLAAFAALRAAYGGPWNHLRGIKLFIDGVVESKTALMLEPYSDGGRDHGLPDMDPDSYRRAVLEASRLGLDVATHAIGDGGVRLALNAYAEARGASGEAGGGRLRIEHIEVIDPPDIARFGQLDVTASMQPLHVAPTGDPCATPWTLLVGPRREPYSFTWRSLREAGANLAFGSDWPIVSPDVRRGLFAALTRQSAAGEPRGGWQPQEALTLAEALAAYTREAAAAEGQEAVKGVLREGMMADLAVFAEDLFALWPHEIPAVPIVLTVVGGRVVHRQGA